MTATVEKQNVMLVPEHRMVQAYRARCWDHPKRDYLIPPWMGEPYVIEPGSASGYNATLEAKIHNLKEHRGQQ